MRRLNHWRWLAAIALAILVLVPAGALGRNGATTHKTQSVTPTSGDGGAASGDSFSSLFFTYEAHPPKVGPSTGSARSPADFVEGGESSQELRDMETANGILRIEFSRDDRQNSAARDFLDQQIQSTFSAVSIFDPAAHGPTVLQARAAWGDAEFVDVVLDHAALSKVFEKRRGERVLAFGHQEADKDGDPAIVVYNINNVPIRSFKLDFLTGEAVKNDIELLVVACATYGAGLSVSVMENIRTEDLPDTLKRVRASTKRADVYAAIGRPGNVAVVSVSQLSKQIIPVRLDLNGPPVAYSINVASSPPGARTEPRLRLGPLAWYFLLMGGFGAVFYGSKLGVPHVLTKVVTRNERDGSYPRLRRFMVWLDRSDLRKLAQMTSEFPFVFMFAIFYLGVWPFLFVGKLLLNILGIGFNRRTRY